MPDNETIQKFKERIDRLEVRFKGCKYSNEWLVPKAELIAVRDALNELALQPEDAAA
jgi:hypothetical protein